jgi:hypothetical protein
MYLFDIQDYCDIGFIGPNNVNFSINGDWADAAGTYRATRDAWKKALNEWYLATIADLPESSCLDAQILLDAIAAYNTDPRIGAFWILTDVNMVGLTAEIYNDYVTSLQEEQCKVKQLFNYLDGDTFEEYIP